MADAGEERLVVSSVLVTGKSPWETETLLPLAVKSFAEQTYPAESRELVVVHDTDEGHEARIHDIVKQAGRVKVVKAPAGCTLGELRNLGLDAASGRLAMQWDGDDYHHPERMAAQVAAYDPSTRLPVFLQRQLCYCLDTDVAFVREYAHTFIHGSILHENAPRFRYPSLRIMEDTEFLYHWPAGCILDNNPRLYVRFCHGDSTSGHDHVMMNHAGERGRWHLTGDQAAFLRGVIAGIPTLTTVRR